MNCFAGASISLSRFTIPGDPIIAVCFAKVQGGKTDWHFFSQMRDASTLALNEEK